jgi:hypothetical protein
MGTAMSKKKVFISYTHDDDTWAKAFADALAQHGLSLWFDQWDIKPGEKISEAIDQALRDSESVVFLLRPESVSSPNLFFELGAAVAMRKKIIPIISEDFERSKIPIPLLQMRYLVRGTPDQTAEEVAKAVA